jgi:hypothetical protein
MLNRLGEKMLDLSRSRIRIRIDSGLSISHVCSRTRTENLRAPFRHNLANLRGTSALKYHAPANVYVCTYPCPNTDLCSDGGRSPYSCMLA